MFEQIKASAGSGKTFTLTRRFLELMREARELDPVLACAMGNAAGYAWPEIMAITFTNKAAAEMKERVVASLKARALGDGGSTPADGYGDREARAHLESILHHFGHLNILTIHSLLNRIVLLSAIELSLPPEFEPTFDTMEVVEALYEEFVAVAADETDPALDPLRKLLGQALRRGEVTGFQPDQKLLKDVAELFAYILENDVTVVSDDALIERELEALQNDFAERAQALRQELDGCGATTSSHFANFLELCCVADLEVDYMDRTSWQKESVSEVCLKKSQPLLTTELELRFQDFKEHVKEFCRRRAILGTARSLAGRLALARTLFDALSDFQTRRRSLLALLWPRLARYVLDPENGVGEALCRLGARLRYLLIDEFQDTSRADWRAVRQLALEALAKGGEFVYVGDVKQAIYGWRGGEPRLFEELPGPSEELARIAEPAFTTLEHNWRSCPEIVDFNNDLFGQLEEPRVARAVADALMSHTQGFDEDDAASLAEDLVEVYRDGRQELAPLEHPAKGYVRIEMVPPQSGDEDAGEGVVRARLLAMVDEIAARRPLSDMAVLVRSNDQAAAVAGWLMDEGVPVITENSLLVAEHPLIRQLVGFLAFLDYPDDDVAFWQFISGRELFLDAAGLERERLVDWLCDKGRGRLFRRFAEDFPEPWEHFIEPFHRQSGLMTPYDLASRAVELFRVRERRPQDDVFVRRFLEILHKLEERDARSLAAFLEYWARKGEEEKIPLPENAPAVRIMTIHKAKGLEFPVAIIPFHDWSTNSPQNDFAEIELDGRLYLARMCKDLGETYTADLAQAILEQINLLYVAWTRPRQELHAFVSAPPGPRRRGLERGVWALLAEAGFDLDEPVHVRGEVPPATAHEETEPAGVAPVGDHAPPVAFDAETPLAWLPRLKVYRNLKPEGPFAFDATMRGEVVHAALERLFLAGDPGEAVETAVAEALAMLPGVEVDRDALADELRDVLRWFLSLEDAEHWLREGRREVGYMDEEGEKYRLDLLVETPGESLVVDYKTGLPDPGHAEQVRRYMRLVRAADGKPARGLLVYLDGREVVPVSETGEAV